MPEHPCSGRLLRLHELEFTGQRAVEHLHLGKGITSYTTDCAWQHSSSHGMFKVVEELNLASICDVVHKSRFCEANKSWHAWMCGLS